MKKTDRKRSVSLPYRKAFYQKNRARLALAAFLHLLDVPTTLVTAWLLGAVIDALAAGTVRDLLTLLWIALGTTAFFVADTVLFHRVSASFLRKAMTQYKSLAFQRLSEKSISAFSKESTGRYLSMLTNDVSAIGTDYLQTLFSLIIQTVTFLATLAMMLFYSPLLTLAAILLCFLPLLGTLAFGPGLAACEKALSDRNEGFTSKLNDLLSGFAVIKSFKAEQEVTALFDGENRAVEQARSRRAFRKGLLYAAGGGLSVVMQFGIFFIGAYLAIRGDITPGTVLIFVNLCNSLIAPVQAVPQYLASRKAARGLIEKLAGLLEENASRSGDAIPPLLRSSLSVEHLTFGYEPGKPVLKDLTLELPAGGKYALVGASGSGKSTLLQLLMGAYDGYEGSLRIDGKELRKISPDSLYDLMSLIGQNVFVFDDTIRRNITMFRDFPEEAVEAAVRRSGLASLLAERGADYRCGENGAGLSGGERQRISIARSLLRGTPVLLLDEATAALDNQTAFAITEAILNLDGLTRLIVTHRLEATLLEQYDGIFVLRDGILCESGSFRELMEKKGYFYSLYTVTGAS